MKLKILILLACLLGGCAIKTNKSSMKSSSLFNGKYAKHLGANEVEVDSWYHYVTSVNREGKYTVRVFYPERMQITSLTTYKSKNELIKDGRFREWYDDGVKKVKVIIKMT